MLGESDADLTSHEGPGQNRLITDVCPVEPPPVMAAKEET